MQQTKPNSLGTTSKLKLSIIVQLLLQKIQSQIDQLASHQYNNQFQDMPNWIQFQGNVRYTFNSPNVTIFCDRIQNTDSSKSGGIMVKLYNTSLKAAQNFGKSNLIASFTLDQLNAGYGYYDVERTVAMESDVIYPYMVITVSQKYASGYQQSDMVEFSCRIRNRVNMRQYNPKKSNKGFRISTVKNGFKLLGQASGAIGAIGSAFCPPLAAVGLIGSAIGAVGSGIAGIIEDIFD